MSDSTAIFLIRKIESIRLLYIKQLVNIAVGMYNIFFSPFLCFLQFVLFARKRGKMKVHSTRVLHLEQFYLRSKLIIESFKTILSPKTYHSLKCFTEQDTCPDKLFIRFKVKQNICQSLFC